MPTLPSLSLSPGPEPVGPRRNRIRLLALRLALALCLALPCALLPALALAAELFQVSTLNALLAGDYDGKMRLEDLRRRGDFGLGTFHALDGEMVLLDGAAYQVAYDGSVHPMSGNQTTPFACVTVFRPGRSLPIGSARTLASLEQQIDQALPTPNLFYALRVDGVFQAVKTRSVPRQKKPYPPLAEVAKSQAVFQLGTVRGSLVGFRIPPFASGVNMPGYHWHFLAEDRTAGGHVLDLSLEGLAVDVQAIADYALTLPSQGDFLGLDLGRDRSAETRAVEGDRKEAGAQ